VQPWYVSFYEGKEPDSRLVRYRGVQERETGRFLPNSANPTVLYTGTSVIRQSLTLPLGAAQDFLSATLLSQPAVAQPVRAQRARIASAFQRLDGWNRTAVRLSEWDLPVFHLSCPRRRAEVQQVREQSGVLYLPMIQLGSAKLFRVLLAHLRHVGGQTCR
jgi:hypothetical protein